VDSTGLRGGLQPRGKVHFTTGDLTAVDQHISNSNPDAQHDALPLAQRSISFLYLPLNLDCRAECLCRGTKLGQDPITSAINNSAEAIEDSRLDDFISQSPDAPVCFRLVASHVE